MSEDWLDTSPAAVAEAVDDWLNIEDTNANATTGAFRHMIDQCMRGTDRVMACDGQYMAYRPMNRVFDKETNPRTKERMNQFLAAGHYTHLGTWDEVQIYRLEPGNPYRHEKKAYVVGTDYWKDIKAIATAACNRQWADYHDLLGAVATALKSGRDPLFARTLWTDTLNQVAIQIKQIGKEHAPEEKEINNAFVEIRRARGITGTGGQIAVLNSDALQKVEFSKGK